MSSNATIIAAFDVADAEFAEKLAISLAEFDFTVQLTNLSTRPAHNISDVTLLLIYSSHVAKSDDWQRMFNAFANRRLPVCVAIVDEVTLPPVLKAVEWVDFLYGYQVGVNGVVQALQHPKLPDTGVLRLNPFVVQQEVLRGTAIGLALLIVGIIVLALLFENL